ncbi:uncharacterized protein JCM15063_000925 [Sporobolomyces koalae]|uniref:uncharacterized protein n=1 Tax=Sporobolomyces koalae TaxID=500713 RepID=UPI00316B0D24
MSSASSRSPPPASERVRHAEQLRSDLTLRLQYARVKHAQARPRHSVAELENLNFSQFSQQAEERKRQRLDSLLAKLQQSMDGAEECTEDRSSWRTISWPENDTKDALPRSQGGDTTEVEDREDEEAPTPPPIYDCSFGEPFTSIPFLAICPPKVTDPAGSRESSVATEVEELCDNRDSLSLNPQQFEANAYFTSLGTQVYPQADQLDLPEQSASASSGTMSYLKQKLSSPFTSSHPIMTTLAPASSVSSLTLPAVTCAPSAPSLSSSMPSSSNSSSRSLGLSTQVSFSALPPPPPLPFSEQTSYSQQQRARTKTFDLFSSSQEAATSSDLDERHSVKRPRLDRGDSERGGRGRPVSYAASALDALAFAPVDPAPGTGTVPLQQSLLASTCTSTSTSDNEAEDTELEEESQD